MQCLECGSAVANLDNSHLLRCCSLTLQEYAIRHHLPLDLLIDRELLNRTDNPEDYPRPKAYPSEQARAIYRGLKWGGLLQKEETFTIVPGEIRRLDMLLWNLQWLSEYGFLFRQEYRYAEETHRVVAVNRLKVPAAYLALNADAHLSPVPPPDFLLSLAVLVAHIGELQAGYLFLQLPGRAAGETIMAEACRHGIEFRELDAADQSDGLLLRTLTRSDTQHLLALIKDDLMGIPCAMERFDRKTPEVTVSKELIFDAAHFITDHPAKCSNLHGGRYLLHVKVRDRIDPVTGCVVDYGYLKRVANRRVIDRFDHHNLNYATSELAWRSSTEMLCVFIWEQLIEYLPGLVELQLYETTQSWCNYSGPTLEAFQQSGSDSLLTHFVDGKLGASQLRDLIRETPPTLEIIAKSQS
ncbi:MAG: 6-carboxytetrahydropterin synthase [Candidatus Thiodiazotropha endolucinida]